METVDGLVDTAGMTDADVVAEEDRIALTTKQSLPVRVSNDLGVVELVLDEEVLRVLVARVDVILAKALWSAGSWKKAGGRG